MVGMVCQGHCQWTLDISAMAWVDESCYRPLERCLDRRRYKIVIQVQLIEGSCTFTTITRILGHFTIWSSTERFQIIDDRSHFRILKTFFLQMLSSKRFILLVIFNKASCITSLRFHILNCIDDVLY